MSIIYLAIVYGGEWDDAWERTLVASKDRAKIESFIATETQKDIEMSRAQDLVYEFRKNYHDTTPGPDCHPTLDIPKWKTGIAMAEITPKMRQERDNIKSRNEMIRAQNDDMCQAWNAVRKEIDLKFIADQGLPFEYDDLIRWSRPSTDKSYRIEEVEEI